MRKVALLSALILIWASLAMSQTAPNDQTVTPAPSAVPAAQDPGRPQSQMPPDGKAPAPTPSAKTTPEASSSLPVPAENRAQPRFLKGGTDIRATLDTPLSTKTSRIGDRFTATITAPVRDAAGYVVVPIGSKLNGQISETTNDRLAGAIKDMGHLNLRFTDIQLPNGASVPISATLVSVHTTKGGHSASSAPGLQSTETSIGASAGMAGAFGPPLRGLAVGNHAGGGYVLATTGKKVDLPAECGLRLRIDRNTPLP